jgi:hypothetical protein
MSFQLRVYSFGSLFNFLAECRTWFFYSSTSLAYGLSFLVIQTVHVSCSDKITNQITTFEQKNLKSESVECFVTSVGFSDGFPALNLQKPIFHV